MSRRRVFGLGPIFDTIDVPVVGGRAVLPDGREITVQPGVGTLRLAFFVPGTQTARLLNWLAHHPGSSSLEITQALRIVNVTGRVSDCRAAGHPVRAVRVDGVYRYWLVEAPVQQELAL